MRAAVVDENSALSVREVANPEPTEDQVLVAVAACGICGSDIHMRRSGLVFPGMVMGHELSGVVVAVGDAVHGWREGDAVTVRPYLPCGACAACTRGLPQVCSNQVRTAMGVGPRPGGLAELATVWPGQLFELPENVPVEAGALAEPLAVGLHGVERADLTPSDRAVVLGGGSIGVMTALALRAAGLRDLVVSEPSGPRREILEDLGFEAVTPADLTRRGDQPDVVFDTTGVGAALSEAATLVRPGGTVVLMGLVEHPAEIVPARWLLKEMDVRTSLAYGDCFPDAVAALGDGRVDIETLTATCMRLDETEEAFRRLASAQAPPKILILPRAGQPRGGRHASGPSVSNTSRSHMPPSG